MALVSIAYSKNNEKIVQLILPGEYLPRLGLALGDRVRITFLTCVVWRSLSFDRWLSYRGRLVLGDGERLESELDPDRELLLELLYEELLL